MFFFERATLSSDEATVWGITVTVELNPTMRKNGGDSVFQPVVIGMGGVVNVTPFQTVSHFNFLEESNFYV